MGALSDFKCAFDSTLVKLMQIMHLCVDYFVKDSLAHSPGNV